LLAGCAAGVVGLVTAALGSCAAVISLKGLMEQQGTAAAGMGQQGTAAAGMGQQGTAAGGARPDHLESPLITCHMAAWAPAACATGAPHVI
jgi:hypothetical protein